MASFFMFSWGSHSAILRLRTSPFHKTILRLHITHSAFTQADTFGLTENVGLRVSRLGEGEELALITNNESCVVWHTTPSSSRSLGA